MSRFEQWKSKATVTWAYENYRCKCWLNKDEHLAGVGDTSEEAWRNAIDNAFEAYNQSTQRYYK